ncbi:MAG TPA: hypothetical protein VJN93_14480 [Candidatus Acidoferrum sp.]|nr:hypothetical protein [Candidatus Acidoferrum sp.]
MNSPAILIISPDLDTQNRLAGLLMESGMTLFFASRVDQAEVILRNKEASVVVCAERLTDGGFSDILSLTKKDGRQVPVIVFSPFADWSQYLTVIRAGGFDYIPFPTTRGEIERVLKQALSFTPEPKMNSVSAA